MNYLDIKHSLAAIDAFAKGEETVLALSDALHENHENLLTLFTHTGVCDVLGNVCPGIQPGQVAFVIFMLYMKRLDSLYNAHILCRGKHNPTATDSAKTPAQVHPPP